MSNAEKLESEAVEIVCVDFLRLPPGRVSGTAERFVRLLVDAAVARIEERQPPALLVATSEPPLDISPDSLEGLRPVTPADSDDLIGDVPVAAAPGGTLSLRKRK